MALFFITGISGSGKSAIQQALRSRGYEAYDTDDDGFAKWQHTTTGYIHPKSSVKAADRTKAFLREHAWNIPREEVAALAKQSQDKTIFLCGVADNTEQLLDLFEAVFALTIDTDTLKHRLATRTGNDWGKQPHELQLTLQTQDRMNTAHKQAGYVLIDATQPLDNVVDEILKTVNQL